MFCINAIVTNHFEMLVGDMNNQATNKVNGRDAFSNGFVIFVSLIMKGDVVTIIRIDSGGGDNRSPEIAADILNGDIRRTFVRFGSDIKAIRMVFVNLILSLLKEGPSLRASFSKRTLRKAKRKNR